MKKIFKYLLTIIVSFVVLSCLMVVFYKFVPPPITPLMVLRLFDGAEGIDKTWCSYDEISSYLFRACIASEDARFLSHEGIDWKAVKQAKRYNELHKNKRLHGASTITMQTAKNVFLWHGRNFIRKGLEAYFTVLIETVWGKKRILEVYANVVEWGNGVYGVEAASQKYFNKSASKLSKREAALLAAVLPNPRKYSPSHPSNYILKRANNIQARMNSISLPKD